MRVGDFDFTVRRSTEQEKIVLQVFSNPWGQAYFTHAKPRELEELARFLTKEAARLREEMEKEMEIERRLEEQRRPHERLA